MPKIFHDPHKNPPAPPPTYLMYGLLMYEIKTEHVYEDFNSNKEIFDFSNYSTRSKYYDDSNKLVIGKIKDETGGVAIEEFVVLKTKMYSFLVDDNSKHKKGNSVNKV